MFRVLLVPDKDTTVILKPCHESFHLPPPLVAAQWATVLGGRPGTTTVVGCDHLDSMYSEAGIQRVAVIRFITN